MKVLRSLRSMWNDDYAAKKRSRISRLFALVGQIKQYRYYMDYMDRKLICLYCVDSSDIWLYREKRNIANNWNVPPIGIHFPRRTSFELMGCVSRQSIQHFPLKHNSNMFFCKKLHVQWYPPSIPTLCQLYPFTETLQNKTVKFVCSNAMPYTLYVLLLCSLEFAFFGCWLLVVQDTMQAFRARCISIHSESL